MKVERKPGESSGLPTRSAVGSVVAEESPSPRLPLLLRPLPLPPPSPLAHRPIHTDARTARGRTHTKEWTTEQVMWRQSLARSERHAAVATRTSGRTPLMGLTRTRLQPPHQRPHAVRRHSPHAHAAMFSSDSGWRQPTREEAAAIIARRRPSDGAAGSASAASAGATPSADATGRWAPPTNRKSTTSGQYDFLAPRFSASTPPPQAASTPFGQAAAPPPTQPPVPPPTDAEPNARDDGTAGGNFAGSQAETGSFYTPTPVRGAPRPGLVGRLAFLGLEGSALTLATMFATIVVAPMMGGSVMPYVSGSNLDELLFAQSATLTSIAATYQFVLLATSRIPILQRLGLTVMPPPTTVGRDAQWGWFHRQMRLMGTFSFVTIVGAFLVIVTFLVQRLNNAPRSLLSVEYQMDVLNSPMRGLPLVWQPIMCELIFRWMLFARCVRMVGVLPAYLISSAASGSVLFAVRGERQPTDANFINAFVYRLSRSVMPPMLLHCFIDGGVALVGNVQNPMEPFSKQCEWAAFSDRLTNSRQDTFAITAAAAEQIEANRTGSASNAVDTAVKTWSLFPPAEMAKSPTVERERSQQHVVILQRWIKTNSARETDATRREVADRTLSIFTPELDAFDPTMARVIDEVFTALDADRKGFLSVDEFAYLRAMQQAHTTTFTAACNVIARRTTQPDTRWTPRIDLDRIERDANTRSTRVRDIPIAALPSELPLRASPGAFASLPLAFQETSLWRIPSVVEGDQRQAATQPTPMRLEEPLQQQLARQWYSLQHTMAYERIFHADQVYELHPHAVPVPVAAGATPLPPRIVDPKSDQSALSFALNGCTRDHFSQMMLREFQRNPLQSLAWVRLAIEVLQGKKTHPADDTWKKRTA